MAAGTDAIFPNLPIIGIATLTAPTAVTSRANITGNTNLFHLVTGDIDATRVDRIWAVGKANTVAGQLCFWMKDNVSNTSYIFDEITISAVTANNTSAAWTGYKDFSTLVLANTQFSIYVSVTVANDLNVIGFGGAY